MTYGPGERQWPCSMNSEGASVLGWLEQGHQQRRTAMVASGFTHSCSGKKKARWHRKNETAAGTSELPRPVPRPGPGTLCDRGHELKAIGCSQRPCDPRIEVLRYQHQLGERSGVHHLSLEVDDWIRRSEKVAEQAMTLKRQGWAPDVMLAHPGWGEALLLAAGVSGNATSDLARTMAATGTPGPEQRWLERAADAVSTHQRLAGGWGNGRCLTGNRADPLSGQHLSGALAEKISVVHEGCRKHCWSGHGCSNWLSAKA